MTWADFPEKLVGHGSGHSWPCGQHQDRRRDNENVTSLVSTMLPPEAPQKETVVWSVERADGGRGVGLVIPHFYRNWRIDDLRTLILNSICWTAKCEIPVDGIQSSLPDLATFEPASVEPKPRPKK